MTPSRAATSENRGPPEAGSGGFGPVWSPDESKIVFFIMADGQWHLGIVNADGSGFRFVKNAGLKSDAFGAPTWARDGKSIFCHDLDNLYHIDLDGNVLKKWALSKVLTEASMNGNDRLSVSPDGKTLLMDVDLGAEHERKNWDGPQPFMCSTSTRRKRLASRRKRILFGIPIG
jgi:TolB protein